MRQSTLLLTVMAAMLFACTGIVLAQAPSSDSLQRPSGKTEHDHATHHHEQEGAHQELGPKTTKSGIFAYITGGETPSGNHEHKIQYFITDEQGNETLLELTDEADLQDALKDLGVPRKQLNDGGPQPLVGKRVTVEGRWFSDPVEGEGGSGEDKIKVESIQNVRSGNAASAFDFEAEPAVTGSKPAVTVACKYAGTTAEPKTTSYFNSLVSGTTKPGIDHFWRETSYDQINLSGSQVVGWYTLPKTRTEYLSMGSYVTYLGALAEDCTALAESSVHFPDYSTINLMFNDHIDNSAWGGTWFLTRDGQSKTYGVTWMPPWGYENVGILAHEMGHSYGLMHSSGPYSQTYDSWWDVMSSGGRNNLSSIGRTDCFRDPTYGCMAMHTISAHKDQLGWIPSGQRYTAASVSQQTVTIDRLGTATSTSGNYLMARIPINGSADKFYTVEARRPVGYDAHAAAEGLVIHKIDPSISWNGDRYARVVDSDNNGNPNDAGATWLPGETFTDSTNNVTVQVTGSTTTGYTARIQNGDLTTDTTAPSVSLTAPEAGAIVKGTEVELSANASDNVGVDGVQFLVGDTVVGTDDTAPYSLAWDSETVPDGQKTVTARAVDAANNSTTSAGRQLIVDNLYPDTVIDSGPPARTKSTKATFRFSSPDSDVIGFRCKLDGKAWVGCGSPKTYNGLSRKRHTFQVTAIGSAGVVLDEDPTPAIRTWTVRRR